MTEPSQSQTKPQEQDLLSVSLYQARRELWKAPPRYLPSLFGPLREFLLDPGLRIAAMILPVATRTAFPRLNVWIAYFIERIYQPLLKFFYRFPSTTKPRLRGRSIQQQARRSLLADPSAPGSNRVILINPPSQLQSAVLGVLAFLISAIGDILGALTNPKKYQGWVNACTQLESYLVSTGVAKELHTALVQPLLQGRLLSNVKILSDIQFEALCVDRAKAAQFPTDEPCNLKDELKWGHKWMRFATAAYGVEMIRSALDKETDSDRVLHEVESAIAFHCQIEESDVFFVYTDTVPDNHILHHFLAVDHAVKSIVLALRGTLSLSGAIVDLRGMTSSYCTGEAHEGMAEMADNIWNQSGEAILNIIQDDKYKGYTFIVTGHSLGAGTACLLNIKLHVEGLLGSDWPIRCYAFAPPPTFVSSVAEKAENENDTVASPIDQAIQHTVAYINDNDVVPHLSVSAVRRLAFLFETVDKESLKIWFWQRWRIFYDYQKVPKHTLKAVVNAVAAGISAPRAIQGASELIIPARVVVWCYQNELGKYEAFACDPTRVAQGHILLSQDMLTDHLPEPYECALDALIES